MVFFHWAIADVSSEWASSHSETRILVAQDNILSSAGIRDANVLIHFDIPELSKFNFGFRFSCLANAMRSFDGKGEIAPSMAPVAHLILSSKDQKLSVELVDFLKRVGAKIPVELQELANKELEVYFTLFPFGTSACGRGGKVLI